MSVQPQTSEQNVPVIRDPVCGMIVDLDGAAHVSELDGAPYYFCSAGCKSTFDAESSAYLEAEDPICGMALEPMGGPVADAGPNPELVDFTRRFWVGLALSAPIIVLAMAPP